MKKIINALNLAYIAVLIVTVMLVSSCNKELDTPAPIAVPTYPTTGNLLGRALAANPNDSLFYKMVLRSGLLPVLNDSTKTFTLFAVDNAGMKLFVNQASGGLVPLNAPDAAFVSFINTNLPVASAAGIITYNLLGLKLPAANIGTAFPNYPYTTQIILDPTQPFVRMPIFPARGTPNSYVNTMPITGVDQIVDNGIIHHTYSVVAPPTATMKSMMAAEANLSYFRAAVLRADSGAVGLGRIDSLLNYGVTNMTVFAPDDNAFKTLLYDAAYPAVYAQIYQQAYALAIGGGATPAQATVIATNAATTQAGPTTTALVGTPAVFSNPALFSVLTAERVKGILAYHILASNSTGSFIPNVRAFVNNFTTTPALYKTVVNSVAAYATHPGVRVQAGFAGPFGTGLTITGLGPLTTPTTPPYSGTAANSIKINQNGANGVYHIIDRVLLPQ